jgi:hypothetical protein
MIFFVNFNKNSCISIIYVVNPKNFVVFAYAYVSRNPTVFMAISAWNYILLTATKRWSEAMKR